MIKLPCHPNAGDAAEGIVGGGRYSNDSRNAIASSLSIDLVSGMRTSRGLELEHQLFRLNSCRRRSFSSISSKRSWAALVSQAGKPKGGCERDGGSHKKNFVAFPLIHGDVLEAL